MIAHALQRQLRLGVYTACLVIASACSNAAQAPDEAHSVTPPITEARARELAVAKYRAVFANRLYDKDNSTGNYLVFPDLDETAFTSVKLDHDVWLVRREVMVGYVLSVRVAKGGEWAAIEQAEFVQM